MEMDMTDDWEREYLGHNLFEAMSGKTLTAIVINEAKNEVAFHAGDEQYLMHHVQDCCESVMLEEVHGDIDDLLNSPLTLADVAVSEKGEPLPEYPESWTWTFYKLATIKGYVTLRWLGESNGYYSESVNFRKMEPS
jgi:hypothetical protein